MKIQFHGFLPDVSRNNPDRPFMFRLICGRLRGSEFVGPASNMNRTICYPCNKFKCRVGCYCVGCRKKRGETDPESNDDALKELEDHTFHQKSFYLECKYCQELFKIFLCFPR